MKLPTPSKRDCKPQPIECFGPPPTQIELRMISKKSGIPLNKLQELVAHIKNESTHLGEGKKKKKKGKKTRKNTGGITEKNKDRLVTSLMVVAAGGAAFYGVPALGNWFVSTGVLPRLCAQNMIQHAFVEIVRDVTQMPIQTCHDISQDYQAKVTAMVGTLLGTGLFNYTNIKDFYNLTHAFIKAKIFGTVEEAEAAQTALVSAGAVQATAAQTALAQRQQKQQQEQRERAATLTEEQKADKKNVELHKKHGFFGRPTEASTRFLSQLDKKPAQKKSNSNTGPGSKTAPLERLAKTVPTKRFIPGSASPSAASVPLPPASFKPPLVKSKSISFLRASPKSSKKSSKKSEEKSSKGGITRKRRKTRSRRKRSRRKHHKRK